MKSFHVSFGSIRVLTATVVVAAFSFESAMLVATAAEPAALPVPKHYPVDAWLTAVVTPGATGPAAKPHPGIEVRNTTTLAGAQGVAMTLQAVAVRAVYWAGTEPDPSQAWTTTRAGTLTSKPDGTVEFVSTPTAPGHATFERGLLLPGERITMDFPPQAPAGEERELVIEYVVVPAAGDWLGNVLLLARTDGATEVYARPTDAVMEARHGNGGGNALLRSQLAAEAAPLPVRKISVSLRLPSQAAAWATGGPHLAHHLTWRGFDGTNDPANAVFVLDGAEVGRGTSGFAQLQQRIAAIPAGHRIIVEPYFDGANGRQPEVSDAPNPRGRIVAYPYDLEQLLRDAGRRGITVLIPSAG